MKVTPPLQTLIILCRSFELLLTWLRRRNALLTLQIPRFFLGAPSKLLLQRLLEEMVTRSVWPPPGISFPDLLK